MGTSDNKNSMKKKTLMILFLLGACSSKSLNLQPAIYSAQIDTEVALFEKTFDKDVAIDVVFVDNFSVVLTPNQAAVCIAGTRVEIKSGMKGRMLRYLVFHELGHCILGLHHWDEERDIMNASVFSAADVDTLIPLMHERYLDGIYQ